MLHKVYLYSHDGYFEMAQKRVRSMAELFTVGIGEEGGFYVMAKFENRKGEVHIASPPEIKRPSPDLLKELLSKEEYNVFLDGEPVNDKSILSQSPKDYYFFFSLKRKGVSRVGLFSKEGYATIVKMYNSIRAPKLNIRFN